MVAKGSKMSPETIEKMRIAHTGKYPSLETRLKRSKSLKGRVKSQETRDKISKANKGKKRTPEVRAKMREMRKNIPLELREKYRISSTGRKHTAETRKKMCGSGNGRWLGGKSFEPYCVLFNKEFKERVREFFDHKCVECGKSEEENGEKHCVHHVNYHKDACCNKDVKPLFVILCRSCHNKTNHGNREYWEERYTNLINTEYDGQCYLPKQ